MSRTIIILGGGFGGIRAALDLHKNVPKGWNVLLVDQNQYHVYYPRLYELALPEDGNHCTIEILQIVKGTRIEFVQGKAIGIDCKGNTLTLADGKVIPFEYLILALGAGTDYFGVEGLEQYACTLKSVGDAEVIRESVGEFLKYTEDRPPGGRRTVLEPFSVVIGGAGATGVEIAAELAYLFRNIPKDKWSIILVEALSSVLWMFPSALGQYAHRRLNTLGVHTMLDTCIKKVVEPHRRGMAFGKRGGVEVVLAPRPLKPREVEAQLACDFLPEHEKRVRADLLLWAGGIRANPLLSACALEVDRKGRVAVDEHLRVKGLEHVFAIGDNASLQNPATGQPVPATAQAAIEQGVLVAQNIVRTLRGRPLQSYVFHNFSAIIPLGHKDAIALIGKRVFHGRLALFLRGAADFRYFSHITSGRRRILRIYTWIVDLFLTNV